MRWVGILIAQETPLLLLLTKFNVQTHLPAGLISFPKVAVGKKTCFLGVLAYQTINYFSALESWWTTNPRIVLWYGLISISELYWLQLFFQDFNLKLSTCLRSLILLRAVEPWEIRNAKKSYYSGQAWVFKLVFLLYSTYFVFTSRSQSIVFLLEMNYLFLKTIKIVLYIGIETLIGNKWQKRY